MDIKKSKKLKKFILAVIFVLFFCGAIVILQKCLNDTNSYIPVNAIFPKQEDSTFPLEITSNSNFETATFGNNFLVYLGSHFNIYNKDDKLIKGYDVKYDNAIFKTSDSGVLIFDEFGSKFALFTAKKQVYEKNIDGKINFALINVNNYVAVFYQNISPNVTYISVYNNKGKNVYNTKYNEVFLRASFTSNNSLVAVATTAQLSGDSELLMKRVYFDFEKDTKTELTGTELNVYPYMAECKLGKVVIFGDAGLAYYKENNNIDENFKFTDTFVNYSYYDGNLALLFYEEKDLQYYFYIFDGNVNDRKIHYNEKPKDFVVKNDSFYVLTDTTVFVYNIKGEKIADYSTNGSYKEINVTENTIYLSNDKEINVIKTDTI